MADDKIAIDERNTVFSIKVSVKYEKNLQAALDYSLQNWGVVAMVNFHLQVIREIDKLAFFPYSNAKKQVFRRYKLQRNYLTKISLRYHLSYR